MKVSVIIPVYNVEKYLRECLESVINQTLNEIEIICINDGSTDDSLEILNEYKNKYKDKDIIIINKKNGGLSEARNDGIKKASGEFIYFLDSDDYINLDTLRICYNESKLHELDMLTFDAESFFDVDYKGDFLKEDFNRVSILDSNIYEGKDFYIKNYEKKAYRSPVWLNFYNTSYIKDNNLYFEKDTLHEDEIHTAKAMIKAKRIKYIPYKFFNRRIREGSIMTSKFSRKRIEGNLNVLKHLNDLYKEETDKDLKEILLKNMFMFLSNCITYCDMINEYDMREKVIKYANENRYLINKYIEIQIKSPSLYYSPVTVNRKSELLTYKNTKKIFYMLIPTHGNLGDQAIVHATLKYLEEKFSDYKIIKINYNDTYSYTDTIEDIKNDDDLVVLHGGGNMGNHYIWEEKARRHIISNLKDIKIISFTQTIFFTDDNEGQVELNKSKEIYNNHKDLTLMAREQTSYEIMKNNFHNNNVVICPDIVFSLIDKLNINNQNTKRKNIMTCFRKDKETYFDVKDKENLINDLSKVYDVKISDTVIKENVYGINREEILNKLFEDFYKSKLIITDRLHGMIIAYITKTPCIVLRSIDYKVIQSYKWIEDVNYIKMVDNLDIDNIKNIIDELLNISEADSTNLNELYFDNIKKLFNI